MKIKYNAIKVRVGLLTTLAFLKTRVSVTTTEDSDQTHLAKGRGANWTDADRYC
jgi:hypothetical protein